MVGICLSMVNAEAALAFSSSFRNNPGFSLFPPLGARPFSPFSFSWESPAFPLHSYTKQDFRKRDTE